MGKLHLITGIPASDTGLAVIESDWARFLPDPTMLEVSLYFARLVYATRRQHLAVQSVVDTHKGRAIRSVRERLSYGSNSLSDSFVGAILILTTLDVRLAKQCCTPVSIYILADNMASNS